MHAHDHYLALDSIYILYFYNFSLILQQIFPFADIDVLELLNILSKFFAFDLIFRQCWLIIGGVEKNPVSIQGVAEYGGSSE